MCIPALMLSVLLSAAPQQQREVIGPNPNQAPRTSDRFLDNERLLLVRDWQREAGRQDREVRLQRTRYRDRLGLADQLDRLISAGDCAGARALAQGSDYPDIAGEVDRVCAGREPG